MSTDLYFVFTKNPIILQWEHSGSVVECLTRGRGAVGTSSPGSLRCVLEQDNINPSLVLVQPKKTHPYITDRLLMGCKESNQTKQKTIMLQ